jgi:hypothetical protein
MAQSPDEKTHVEIPFIEQLKGMGCDHYCTGFLSLQKVKRLMRGIILYPDP